MIVDSCVGKGFLLHPFLLNGCNVYGIDIEDQGFGNTHVANYLELTSNDVPNAGLVIINPPFNIDIKTRDYIKRTYGNRPLLPELWLMKALELWGENVPIVLFTPYGFRLNQTITSKRWKKFINGIYPEICSIISLPKNIFDNILFHSEILIFNIAGLKGHYFYG